MHIALRGPKAAAGGRGAPAGAAVPRPVHGVRRRLHAGGARLRRLHGVAPCILPSVAWACHSLLLQRVALLLRSEGRRACTHACSHRPSQHTGSRSYNQASNHKVQWKAIGVCLSGLSTCREGRLLLGVWACGRSRQRAGIAAAAAAAAAAAVRMQRGKAALRAHRAMRARQRQRPVPGLRGCSRRSKAASAVGRLQGF
jgi:hypothetical protein